MGEVIIKTKNLSVKFGGILAVDRLNMVLSPGRITGLIGPNGAGKTTVLNLLTGICPATSGDIYLDGRRMNGEKPYKFVRCGVARTFQNIRLFKRMTVEENLWVPLSNREFRETDMEKQARGLLTRFNLEGFAHDRAGQLPYGSQRMLEIARALATGARVLLLDEPAAGLNPMETDKLKEIIVRLVREKNLAVLLIEHHMPMVMEMCRDIYVLNFGKTIAVGSPSEISRNKTVLDAYFGGADQAYT